MILIFPRHDTVFDKNIPTAGTGAVYAMRGAHHFVIRPTVTIHGFPVTAALILRLMT